MKASRLPPCARPFPPRPRISWRLPVFLLPGVTYARRSPNGCGVQRHRELFTHSPPVLVERDLLHVYKPAEKQLPQPEVVLGRRNQELRVALLAVTVVLDREGLADLGLQHAF